ncbi:Laccase family multicopper oxidase (modular protein) [Nostocoides australiense Ben110]|uniref:Laccase family multicopper oxidase (Modular protein) n=1 Tax=Nostocoides australiense Ben110 TaxID=1193182 RepID=W6JTV6_9MICO|nr:fibronectin type III domain-containing protein [Tetrasphaera australiensis]CCH72292.1 Laccase family multicopper oxidase (modular protein) [Tetrasphaera australiensis Ben110]
MEFGLPDAPDGQQAKGHVEPSDMTSDGKITKVTIDDPGSGYYSAPDIAVRNGTLNDPVGWQDPMTGQNAQAATSLALDAIVTTDPGTGYDSAPTVTVTDPVGGGSGAQATVATQVGALNQIVVDAPGAGYYTGGIRKFQNQLPLPCDPANGGCPTTDSAKYIPVGVPTLKTYDSVDAEQYVIALVQYRTKFNSDIPATLVRGYVQVDTGNVPGSQHVQLFNELLDGTKVAVKDTHGNNVYGVTSPQWLGPFLQATKNKPVRVIFHNYLPKGADGDLFLPVDSSMMGSGMGPMNMSEPSSNGTVMDDVRNPSCTDMKDSMCFKDNRATLHLHGGITPWISDGTPHQWITPAGENTPWPQGVSVANVPDMSECTAADDGCMTFFYSNQQSARLMFYHDHAWGITRLNVYAGEAAGYTITDDAEKKLVSTGTIPNSASTIPLIVQDRTFVPGDDQLYDVKDGSGKVTSYGQDPTWDKNRWGGAGSFWYHHVYMPAQNPGDPSGFSAYGRWMYGPWFYPPASGTTYGPIDNPYYDPACDLDVPSTWQYKTDPFCEPKKIPGTPNISAGMEQFNDTPVVNGVAYPTVTLQPKSYRFRMLNAANDRFWNFQWYVADPDQKGPGGTLGEVKLNPDELAAAQTNPSVFPTPVRDSSTNGPDWIQIANEGGFLPAPVVIDGQQPITWNNDQTLFQFGNVDQHSLVVAPAERADVIVDFSKYAGKTLILYNDSPAAYPARVPSYDYYTGSPDLSPNGAPGVVPGYGPNTRTVMQVKIAAATPATAFNLTKLKTAFKHNVSGTGVFESSQNPIIVGQAGTANKSDALAGSSTAGNTPAGYNSAYGTSFATSGDCNSNVSATKCDGAVRINDLASHTFNTLKNRTSRNTMGMQHKAIHDEMNATNFDEYGRMTANLGVENSSPQPGNINATLYPYVNPPTELIDGTKLQYGTDKITPIATMDDGTQIWRITHNGVDTHPIHFHLYDVQVLNRVAWDNQVIWPDANELGWKDTVRMSPLMDTIVALRPIIPKTPFEVPNSIRNLNPMMPTGSTAMFNPTDMNGDPTAAVLNQLVNFGWEYVWHCHILSHEEMDMMRPQSLAVPPIKPDGVMRTNDNATNQVRISWNDNSITETSFVVQRSSDGVTWADVVVDPSPLDQPNTHGTRTVVDPTAQLDKAYKYRVVALNEVGYGGEFPSLTVKSVSDVMATPPDAPSGLTVAQDLSSVGRLGVDLSWTDNSTDETGFTVSRSTDGGATWTPVGTTLAPDTTSAADVVTRGVTYTYRVTATNAIGSTNSESASITLVKAPDDLAAASSGSSVKLTWTDSSTVEDSYVVKRSTDGTTWTTAGTVAAVSGSGSQVSYTDTSAPNDNDLQYRVDAVKGSDWDTSNVAGISFIPAPSDLTVTGAADASAALSWTNASTKASSLVVRRSSDGGTTWTTVTTLAATATSYTDTGLTRGSTYLYQVGAVGAYGTSWSASASLIVVLAPTGVNLTVTSGPVVNVTWVDAAVNETGYQVQRSTDGGITWSDVGGALPANSTSYDDTSVADGGNYAYRVGAISGADTAWSATAGPISVLKAPNDLRFSIVSGPARARLTWTDTTAYESRYDIQRSSDGGATFTTVLTKTAVGGTGTSVSVDDRNIVQGTTYYYRVVAVRTTPSGSASSNVVMVIADVPLAPTVTGSATATDTTETLKVSWNDLSNETGYQVAIGVDGTTTATTVSVAANQTSYTRTNLSKRPYYVRVRGINGFGGGAWSVWVLVPLP